MILCFGVSEGTICSVREEPFCKGNPRFGHLSQTSRGDPKCYSQVGKYKGITNLVGEIQRENSKVLPTHVLHALDS